MCVFTFFIDGEECDFCQNLSRQKTRPCETSLSRLEQGRIPLLPGEGHSHRTVDDFQPRAQLRKLFNEGNMDIDKHDDNKSNLFVF